MDYKSHFPIFTTYPDLIYLDSAATTQKPTQVIEALTSFYVSSNAPIHRGLYPLAVQATTQYEQVRATIASFIKAKPEEIIFTRNATEGINLIASSFPWQEKGEIILSELEHHANLVPWQQAAIQHNLHIKFVKNTETGELDVDHFRTLINENTQLVSFSHCSNVLGTFLPSHSIKKILHKQGSQAAFLLDASQSVAHLPLSTQELQCDFLVFSGHKIYGPSGIGMLWGRTESLQALSPYQTGGDMIRSVSLEESTWNDLPWKFEAGTPNIEGAIGLAAALSFVQSIGMDVIKKHTEEISGYAKEKLSRIPEVTLVGSPDPASGIIAFTIKDLHPHDSAELLGEQKICIRAGHHCAMPLHAKLGLVASNRISIGIYTTKKDIDLFSQALINIIEQVNRV